jgi:hypothetical protein
MGNDVVFPASQGLTECAIDTRGNLDTYRSTEMNDTAAKKLSVPPNQ